VVSLSQLALARIGRRFTWAALLALTLSMAIAPQAGSASGDGRVALVIGNAAYEEAPLRNPVNDARAMAKRLFELGFKVTKLEDATRNEMERAIAAFEGSLGPEKTGLFYYAGHGIQVRGRNYLIPIDAGLKSERSARFEAVDVGSVTEAMEYAKSKVNLVILDACRNNPFERRWRGQGRGLAAVDAARGTLIAYATAPGSVAADGDGENGLYTESLLTVLQTPGLSVEEVFKQVRAEVDKVSGGAQTPWESSSLTGSFIFNAPITVTVKQATPLPSRPSADREVVFWESVEDSKSPASFEAYLRHFPNGLFADLARIRIDELKTKSPASSSTQTMPISPPATTGNQDPKAQRRYFITELLKAADADIAALRLTSPRGRNAVDKYRQVLGLEAGNAKALAGLDSVVAKYIGLAEKSSSRLRKKSYLDRADAVVPGSEAVEAARERLLADGESPGSQSTPVLPASAFVAFGSSIVSVLQNSTCDGTVEIVGAELAYSTQKQTQTVRLDEIDFATSSAIRSPGYSRSSCGRLLLTCQGRKDCIYTDWGGKQQALQIPVEENIVHAVNRALAVGLARLQGATE
jgi:hypothetical protein